MGVMFGAVASLTISEIGCQLGISISKSALAVWSHRLFCTSSMSSFGWGQPQHHLNEAGVWGEFGKWCCHVQAILGHLQCSNKCLRSTKPMGKYNPAAPRPHLTLEGQAWLWSVEAQTLARALVQGAFCNEECAKCTMILGPCYCAPDADCPYLAVVYTLLRDGAVSQDSCR